MIRIGIDNGADGGIVALKQKNELIEGVIMPTLDVGVMRGGKRGKKRILNMNEVHRLFKEWRKADKDVFAILEHAQVFPGEGRSTAFTAGRNYGAIEMALVATGIPYAIVRPRAWQKEILNGIEGCDTKARAILKSQRTVPELNLLPGKKRKPHTGLADAACLALYGHIRHGGQ
jgi:putative intracellular protease/amidase